MGKVGISSSNLLDAVGQPAIKRHDAHPVPRVWLPSRGELTEEGTLVTTAYHQTPVEGVQNLLCLAD